MARKKSVEPRYRIQLQAKHWNRILVKMGSAECYDDIEILKAISEALDENIPIDTSAPVRRITTHNEPLVVLNLAAQLERFKMETSLVDVSLYPSLYEYVVQNTITLSKNLMDMLEKAYMDKNFGI